MEPSSLSLLPESFLLLGQMVQQVLVARFLLLFVLAWFPLLLFLNFLVEVLEDVLQPKISLGLACDGKGDSLSSPTREPITHAN